MEQHSFQHIQLQSYLHPETSSVGTMAAVGSERELVYGDEIIQDGEKEAEKLIMEAKKWSTSDYPVNPAELQLTAVPFYKGFSEGGLTVQELPSYRDLQTTPMVKQQILNNGICEPPESQKTAYDSSITPDNSQMPYASEIQHFREGQYSPCPSKEMHRFTQVLPADNKETRIVAKEGNFFVSESTNQKTDAEVEQTREVSADDSETDIEGNNDDTYPCNKVQEQKVKEKIQEVTETWEGDILEASGRRRNQDRRSPRLSLRNKVVTVQTMGEIVLPANFKSPVWEYFSFQVSDVEGGHKMVSKNVSVCRLCKTHVRCMGNTTNMATHLKRHHPEIELFEAKEKEKKHSSTKSSSKIIKRKTSSPSPPLSPPLPSPERQEKKQKKFKPSQKSSLPELKIDGDVFDRWWRFGTAQGLDSDMEIASFLLCHYESSMKNIQPGSCQSCQAPITMLCSKCIFTFEAMPSQPSKVEEGKIKDEAEVSDHEMADSGDPYVSADEVPVKFAEPASGQSSSTKKQILLRTKRKFRKRPMQRRESVKVYRCEQCVAVFKHPKSLENHMQTHTDNRPFKCQECETAFKRSSDLAVHMRTHTGERPYKCDLCEAAFTQSCALSRHIRTHPGAVPVRRRKLKSALAQAHMKGVRGPKPKGPKVYNCDQCWKSFRSSSNLKVHMRIHTGERPYTCEVCGATFTQSSALSLHKRTHQQERPFKCNQCDGSFKRSSDLAIHMRTHTGERPYVCELCGSAFAQLSTLTIHMSSHSDNKPYKCQECGMMFKLTSHLQRHLKTHVGHVPCDHCGAMFKSPVALARHVRKHSSPDGALVSPERFVNMESAMPLGV